MRHPFHHPIALLIAALTLLLHHPAATQAQPYTGADGYPLAFDPTTEAVRTDRQLSAITLGATTLTLPQPSHVYNDLTPNHFTVHPGQTLWPAVTYRGQWMQTYIYIDLNQNGRFDVATPGPQGELTDGNELLAFAGMNVANGAYNSAGDRLSNLAAVQPPTFTLPDTLQPGRYMMRWKVDWNDADPAGRVDPTNSIIANGGAVVDVYLVVTEEPQPEGYELIFADEFNSPDGSRPDPAHWAVPTRSSSVWNRWISDAPEVATIEDGHLVCRAIPAADTSADSPTMITGAVQTRDLFAFTYGRVDIRLRTNLHTGNFPAAWMMPQPPCTPWPTAGEIDIFESIDAENRAYHTVHSNWTYNLGHKNAPKSSFTTPVYVNQWHVYSLLWTPDELTWSIDGRQVAAYARSTDATVAAQGQWPFDHAFYIILNQSVGNGSWAAAADTNFTYETRFDYVRVYQLPSDGVADVAATHRSTTLPSSTTLPATPRAYDLAGRPLTAAPSLLAPGIYVVGGRKLLVR